jgi:hypothetical protein
MTVVPSITTADASVPRTGVSTLLVRSGVSSVTSSMVLSGMVIVRRFEPSACARPGLGLDALHLRDAAPRNFGVVSGAAGERHDVGIDPGNLAADEGRLE